MSQTPRKEKDNIKDTRHYGLVILSGVVETSIRQEENNIHKFFGMKVNGVVTSVEIITVDKSESHFGVD